MIWIREAALVMASRVLALVSLVLVGNGGMGFWGPQIGTLRDYHRDPFPHSCKHLFDARRKETKENTHKIFGQDI